MISEPGRIDEHKRLYSGHFGIEQSESAGLRNAYGKCKPIFAQDSMDQVDSYRSTDPQLLASIIQWQVKVWCQLLHGQMTRLFWPPRVAPLGCIPRGLETPTMSSLTGEGSTELDFSRSLLFSDAINMPSFQLSCLWGQAPPSKATLPGFEKGSDAKSDTDSGGGWSANGSGMGDSENL